jgi:hypothetical protein
MTEIDPKAYPRTIRDVNAALKATGRTRAKLFRGKDYYYFSDTTLYDSVVGVLHAYDMRYELWFSEYDIRYPKETAVYLNIKNYSWAGNRKSRNPIWYSYKFDSKESAEAFVEHKGVSGYEREISDKPRAAQIIYPQGK